MKTIIRAILFSRNQLFALSGMLAVLAIDFLIPLGVAVGVLYLFCFFLVCRENKKVIILFAIITSLLTITKLIVFVTPETNWMVYSNRIITLLVILIMAILSLRHRTLIEKTNAEKAIYVKELEQMLFMTSHRVRQPIANCLGLMNVIDIHNPSKGDIMKIYDHVKTSATQLDVFTRELTEFICKVEEKKKNSK